MMVLKKKKAQSAVEFVLIVGVMFLIFLGMFMVIEGRMAGAYKDRLYNIMEELGRLITTEIRMAHTSPGAYAREFTLPYFIGGYDYTIDLYDKTEVVVRAEDLDFVIFLDYNISGSIQKGKNLIIKENNNITITPVA